MRTIHCAMGFEIWKHSATPPAPSREPAPGRAVLPPVLVEAGAKRLAPVALLASFILFAIVTYLLGRSIVGIHHAVIATVDKPVNMVAPGWA